MITIETGDNKYICVIKGNEEIPFVFKCPNCDTRRFYNRFAINASCFNINLCPIIYLKCDCNAEIQIIGETKLLDEEILGE